MSDDSVREAVGHLQGAALELVAAARAVLDLAEEMIRDPAELLSVATAAARRASRPPSRPPSGPGSSEGGRRVPTGTISRSEVS